MTKPRFCVAVALVLLCGRLGLTQVTTAPSDKGQRITYEAGKPFTPEQIMRIVSPPDMGSMAHEPNAVPFFGREKKFAADFIALSTETFGGPGARVQSDLAREALTEVLTKDRDLAKSARHHLNTVIIVAGSEEEARELTQRLLRAMDKAWESRRDQYLKDSIERTRELYDEANAALCHPEQSVVDARKTLEDVAGVDEDDLRKQLLHLDIDISGLQAKLAAARKILEGLPAKEVSQRAAAETAAVTTEIELADRSARQVRIKSILAVVPIVREAHWSHSQRVVMMRRCKQGLQRLEQATKIGAQPFMPSRGRVYVHKIHWPRTQAGQERSCRDGSSWDVGKATGRLSGHRPIWAMCPQRLGSQKRLDQAPGRLSYEEKGLASYDR